MIKEVKKNKEKKKTLFQIISGYFRTVMIAFSIAFFITFLLSLHARSEMIRNLQTYKKIRVVDEKIAKQLVQQTDWIKELPTKSYSVCMQVGNLYESVQDYANAEYAYKTALEKAKSSDFNAYYKLSVALIEQEKFNEAENLISSVKDYQNKSLIKFKTRAYIVMGDKYYSINKFLKAAKAYEMSKYYYDKFSKSDPVVVDSIKYRIYKSYDSAADYIIKQGYNSYGVKYLKKALKYSPDNDNLKYKLAIVYADLDPEASVNIFDKLQEKIPQYIDYEIYNRALMKAANIADLEGRKTVAKYYRYKIHSKDLFINNKVIYKKDVEIELKKFDVKKVMFKYRFRIITQITNISSDDIYNMNVDFVLKNGDKVVDIVTLKCVNKNKPLFSNGGTTSDLTAILGKNIFTKRELKQYTVEVYLYKDEKYKTLVEAYKLQ